MKKLKLILDIILLLMMITFFNKNLISMQYHEIAGLIMIGLVIVHIAINTKMITAMCKNFIRIPLAIKAGVITDILLLLCFLWIGLSGVFISHTILTFISSTNVIFKLGHMFAGGLSVILLGIHIGLHICRKPMPVILAIIVSAVVFCGGIFGAVNSSEIRWLSMPFTAMTQSDNTGEIKHEGEFSEHRAEEKLNQNDSNTQSDDLGMQNRRSKNMPSITWAERFGNVFMFLSMILLCSMITYWLAYPKKKKIQCNIKK